MLAFYRSTIGKKVLVALTGLALLGFVIGHLIGNLQVFLGPEKINAYARFLHDGQQLLWGTRVILIISALAHIDLTVQLTRLNRASRPVDYAYYQTIDANIPSRFMIWSGVLVVLFVLFHLSHFSLGWTHPDYSHHDVYANIIVGFQVWYVALFYCAAMVALGFHLYHGVYSIFQTLGINNPQINKYRRPLAVGSALAITAGYLSIPIAVWAGILK